MSFLAQVTFNRQRGAAAFMAQSPARHFQAEGALKLLKLPVPVDLPPVGLITVRRRPLTAVTRQLVECLRKAARSA